MSADTGIVITARVGSTRLKRKHFLEVDGFPILFYLIKRIEREFHKEIFAGDATVSISTAHTSENRAFEQFASPTITVFYGPEENIPLRVLLNAEQKEVKRILVVEGDDIMCSRAAMRRVYDALSYGKDYVKVVGLPLGMNCFGFSRAFLESSLRGHRSEVVNTGWLRIMDETEPFRIDISGLGDERLRLTVDYEEDYRLVKAILETLGPAFYEVTDEQLVDLVLKERLFELNRSRVEEYWRNFHCERESEVKASHGKSE